MTPRRRAEVFEAVEAGMAVTAACLAFRVSRRWYYPWLPRWQADGRRGMLDRSSRPHRSPQLVSRSQEEHVALLRQLLSASADTIASLTGIPRSTVHRILRRRGLQRPKPPREPVVRYEYAEPGAMVHIDTKKLGRFDKGPGHRIHGDRRRRHRGAGWEFFHVAVDDCTRLVHCEVLADEKGRTAAHFLIRAVRWFREQGITVDRLLTDNGSPYKSKAWRRVCRAAGVRYGFTRPYSPQTNGKAERWIQTVLRECLYLWAFDSSDDRRQRLQGWVRWYNRHRPHRSLHGLPPTRRLAQLRAA